MNPSHSPAWGRWKRLAQKELRETLRDRRTIVTLVLMPLLVYPLLNIAFQRYLLSGVGAAGQVTYHIGVESREKAEMLDAFLALGDRLLRDRKNAANGRGADDRLRPTVEYSIGDHLERAVRELRVDLAARVKLPERDYGPNSLAPIDSVLIYRPDSPMSEASRRYVEERLRAVNEHWLQERLQPLGVSRLHLAEISRQPIAGEGSSAVSFATLAPLILILMTITGAVYPAIDLTAGERERGTLETLMAAPLPRMGLLLAKYVAVMTVALLTATVNFAAMAVTLVSSGLAPLLFGEEGLQAAVVVQVFLLTILFAAFFSAVLLAVTSFARSFKEAQAYLIPLTLASLAPGFLAFTPGLELNGWLAVAPLANIVLVARDMFQGGVEPLWLTAAVASTLLYALLALNAAARIFGADALLFGAEEGWTGWLRRPTSMRTAAPLSSALICLAVLLPAYLLLANWLAQFREAPLAARLLGSAAVTAVLFGGLPLVAAYLGGVSLRDGFAVRKASPLQFLGAGVLGFSLWPLAHEIFLLNRKLGLVSLDEETLQPALRLAEQLTDASPWLVLACLAITPAVFEELFFRGYLFGAVRARTDALQAVAITAFLFGAFHVFSSILAVERMLPSLFLGLILGWVRVYSGSVLPGILLHACHNGFLLMLAVFREELAARGWGVEETTHLPASWLAAAAVGVAAGGALVWLGFRGEAAPAEKPESS
ncbi:MAG: ABC transporter permease subunit [Planctomycetes bacterium]|nr:ABC transporter permease subunit [Planctomycetota bacterium]